MKEKDIHYELINTNFEHLFDACNVDVLIIPPLIYIKLQEND
jgi:hypothetical protein